MTHRTRITFSVVALAIASGRTSGGPDLEQVGSVGQAVSCTGAAPWSASTPWTDYVSGVSLRTGSNNHLYKCMSNG